VIVEHVAPGSVAEQAGMLPGCRLTGAQGQLAISPAVLLALEENAFGGQSVTLRGEWEGRPLEFVLKPGNLGVIARPDLPAEALAEYELGQAGYQARRFAEAARSWSEAAGCVAEPAITAWMLMRAGAAWESAPDWGAAAASYLAVQ